MFRLIQPIGEALLVIGFAMAVLAIASDPSLTTDVINLLRGHLLYGVAVSLITVGIVTLFAARRWS